MIQYELYQCIYSSKHGASIGSGMGFVESFVQMIKDRRNEKDVRNDTLQKVCVVLLLQRVLTHDSFALSTLQMNGSVYSCSP